jgi:acetoacetyl-CoA reductase/3-oxoacyl-[acyl-carrier protein] reductase
VSATVHASRFAGRHAVVTAAAHGIGRATALTLARQGATSVSVVDTDPQCEDTAQEIRNLGVASEALRVDCTDAAAVAEGAARIHAKQGRIDILVNGVGSSARERAGEFYRSSPEVWDFVLATSLRSVMLWSREVVPGMRERRHGKIVNISTDAWLTPAMNFVDYAAAKAGVVGFTRSLAFELAPHGVNVNAISPGLTRTRVIEALPAAMMADIEASIPMHYVAEPQDMANVIAFLASEEARYITGQNIAVNGGRSML